MKHLRSQLFAGIIIFLSLFSVSIQGAAASEVLHAVLKNGLRVVIVRNTLAPVVTTRLTYLAGSNEAPAGFPGMAHAQEHMMFRGSKGLSAEQLANLTAAMGGRSNAFTRQSVTQYFFTVPADALETALRIEAIRMKDVLDTEALWSQERGAIEQEVARDLSSPMYVFYSRLLAQLFAGTPYAHDALGTRPSFDKTTGAMLKEFHDTWYVPNNAVLVIAGDVDPAHALSLVKQLFGNIPAHPLPPRPEIKLHPLKPARIQLESDLPYQMAIVAYRFPGYTSPDFAASQILADILDSQRAKLYGLAADGKVLFAGFNNSPYKHVGLGYAIAGFPKGKEARTVIALLKTIVDDYLQNGFPEDLVEAAKRKEIAAAEFQKNSIEGLAGVWARAIALEGKKSPDEAIEAMKSVTVSEVNRVARAYLRNETATVGVLIPHASGKPVLSKGFQGKESFGPKQTKPVALPPWARNATALPSVPASRVHPTVITLKNGLRLIIQPETISNTVSLYGRVKNTPELQEPDGQEGITDVLEGLFSYGTTSHDRLSFQKEVDDIAAALEVGRNFSLQVLTRHFDRGVALLADNLLRPALPEPAFIIVRNETAAHVAGKLQSPSYVSRRALLSRLYPKNDPRQREATPGSIKALTLQQVKEYYRNTFRPDLTTIVIIGKVTPKQAESAIKKYFSAWNAEGPKPETDLPQVPPNKPATALVPDKSRVQDRVTLVETLGITRTHPDYYPLNVGLHVLSGGFYATRLYRDLRKRAGLVYTVQAFLQARKTRSVFGVVYGCDPPNVSKARALVVQNLKQMQNEPVTVEELNRAKTLLVRQIPLSESSIDDIGETLLALAVEDLPLDEPVKGARRYLNISAREVQEAFTQWIRPDDFVQVTLGPVPR
ncbi:MAG: insulinase family protein [Deltaproteobacteria bacterium]|nr:insulinase family protein [Deltaproteobacteria bacterium]